MYKLKNTNFLMHAHLNDKLYGKLKYESKLEKSSKMHS